MNHPTDRITHTTAFVTPVVEHWLKREIAQWVHSVKDRSVDPSHHELSPCDLISWMIILANMNFNRIYEFAKTILKTELGFILSVFLLFWFTQENIIMLVITRADLRRCGAQLGTISVGPGSQSTCTKVCRIGRGAQLGAICLIGLRPALVITVYINTIKTFELYNYWACI